MHLFTSGAGYKQDVTEGELLAAFADDRARGEGLSLEAEDGSVLMATGEGFGPYTLEHFPSPRTGRHLRACEELKKGEVQVAMVDYLRRGSAWRKSCTWREVEDGTDGLVAVLGALQAAAPWVLIVVGIIGVSHSASRLLFLAEPAGDAAIWGFAGLVCLIVGVALAVRSWFAGAPRA